MTNDTHAPIISEAHVETIIETWGEQPLPQVAEKLGLPLTVVEDIVAEIRKLKRASDEKGISPLACLTNESIKAIVRCVGARRGYGV